MINVREYRRGSAKMDNPVKPPSQSTQDEEKQNTNTTQHNMCWTPLCKHNNVNKN